MKVKDKAKPSIPPVAPGVYIGICVGVIDLGDQYSEKFKKYSNDVQFVWELVGETVEIDGEVKPRQLSRTFSVATSSRSNLRKFLSSWNGTQYSDSEFGDLDLFGQLGKACQLQVVLSEDGQYANIDNIMAIPKGMPVPTTESAFVRWDMDAWDDGVFDALPEWVQEKIKKSTQYQKLHTPREKVEFEETPPEVAAAVAELQAEEECPI